MDAGGLCTLAVLVDGVTDGTSEEGVRIARRIASAVAAREALAGLAVDAASGEVDPTIDATLAYRIEADETRLAEVYAQRDRARVEFAVAPAAAARAGRAAGLRVRPKAVRPPRTLAFAESNDQVDRVVDVVETVHVALE